MCGCALYQREVAETNQIALVGADRGLGLRQGGLATSLLLLGVLGALSQELAVLGLGLLGRLGTGALVRHASALALEGDRGDQTLDLGRDQLGLLALLLDGAADDVLRDGVALLEGEQLADVVGALGTETTWDLLVGETLNLALTLLDNGQAEDGEVVVDNATAD